ncbi:hypothetical protein HU200_007117 [Digitaria exilis]|uniref:Uncharacterized protein n=1 Tax=Digitaria exilis TaxID=1010633 RepID=A0A835FRB4_9POAL|nr:hypothetical protein HU200_007117 [Digitaria exilis]
MDEFELEDNLEFILQSIQELMEDQGENNAFGDANQNELFASLVNYDHVRGPPVPTLSILLLGRVVQIRGSRFGLCCGDFDGLLLPFGFWQENMLPDVSAADVAAGKDMQGIPWEKMLFGRDQYREMKMKNYRNYQNLSYAREDAVQVSKTIRRLSVGHRDQGNNYSQAELASAFQKFITAVTTMAVDSNLLVVGWLPGGVICKRLDDDGVVFSTRVTDDENAITNSLEIYQDPSGSRRLVAANNDCSIRIFDTEYFDLLKHYGFPWSVNSVSVSPDGKLFAVLGDHEDGLVVDPKCGKTTAKLTRLTCLARLVVLSFSPDTEAFYVGLGRSDIWWPD